MQGASQFAIKLSSGELSVRDALEQLKRGLSPIGLSNDDLASVEVVLGEVLNNIVEHAYGRSKEGEISISCVPRPFVLRFSVEDEGAALPDEQLPEGELPCLQGPLETLPEGGFGWYLVRNLSFDLKYQRVGQRNVLAFSIPVEGKGQCPSEY